MRVPPSDSLEGFDLRPYGFLDGRLYDVPEDLAAVLVDWGYAERPVRRQQAADRKRR
ncbi:MAG TPA: hypothetical protein VGY57_07550 [Vicinamibacterales bacterium]|nr:hypothetical protein [Vicinamibacterales bacterium]